MYVTMRKDEGEDEKLVSTKEAAQCFKKCLLWMESQNDIDPAQLMQLRRMMDFAMQSSYNITGRNCVFPFIVKVAEMHRHLFPLRIRTTETRKSIFFRYVRVSVTFPERK